MSSILADDTKSTVEYDDEVKIAVQANIAEQEEHHDTVLQTLKKHPKALAWCLYALGVLTLSSYDNQAGGVFLNIPEFRKDFGFAYEGNYVLPAKWQSAFGGGPTASAVIGAIGSSYLADAIGRKPVYSLAFMVMLVGVTLETVATTNGVFFAGKFINGFAVGAFGTVTMTYLGEIAPLSLRGTVTAGAGFSYTFGPLVVSLVQNSYGDLDSRWAYRGIFISQYGVTALGIIGLPFMPESPWWLVSRGRDEKAARSLRRLGQEPSGVSTRIASIKQTLEKARNETDRASFAECFRKSNLRRTMIAILPLSIQALSGVIFIQTFSTYYMQLAGYSNSASFKLYIVQVVLAMSGNIGSWFLVDRAGRRNLSIWGLAAVAVTMAVSGGLGTQTSTASCVKGVIALWSIYGFVYNLTIGATAYNLVAEVATARLRVKTASMAYALQSALYTMWSFVLPYIFNPNEANLGAKTAFIFSGLCIISLAYMWLFQPETSGRTYEELDEMFMKQVPARKFKSYKTEFQQRAEAVGDADRLEV